MKKEAEDKPWVVDSCRDNRGYSTIRVADGSASGDTSMEPIATVYDVTIAAQIVAIHNYALNRGGFPPKHNHMNWQGAWNTMQAGADVFSPSLGLVVRYVPDGDLFLRRTFGDGRPNPDGTWSQVYPSAMFFQAEDWLQLSLLAREGFPVPKRSLPVDEEENDDRARTGHGSRS